MVERNDANPNSNQTVQVLWFGSGIAGVTCTIIALRYLESLLTSPVLYVLTETAPNDLIGRIYAVVQFVMLVGFVLGAWVTWSLTVLVLLRIVGLNPGVGTVFGTTGLGLVPIALVSFLIAQTTVQPIIVPILSAVARELPPAELALAYQVVDSQTKYSTILQSAMQGSTVLSGIFASLLLAMSTRMPVLYAAIATLPLPLLLVAAGILT